MDIIKKRVTLRFSAILIFEDILDVLVNEDFKIGIIGMGDYQRGDGSLKSFSQLLKAKAVMQQYAPAEISPLLKLR
jgi:hypothetical protein